jgi:hypothetical protein
MNRQSLSTLPCVEQTAEGDLSVPGGSLPILARGASGIRTTAMINPAAKPTDEKHVVRLAPRRSFSRGSPTR